MERKEILKNPEKFISKTVSLNLILSGIDKDKKIITFIPDRSTAVPLCVFEIKYENSGQIEEISDKIFNKFLTTIIIEKVTKPEVEFGLQDWRNYVYGKLADIKIKE